MKIWLTLLAVVALGGCVYEQPLFLDEQRKVDDRILGRWVVSDSTRDQVEIHRYDDDQYLVLYQEPDQTMLFQLILSASQGIDLAQVRYIGVQGGELKPEQRKYMFYRYQIEEGRIRMQGVDDGTLGPSTATTAQLQAALQANIGNENLFDEGGYLIKSKGADSVLFLNSGKTLAADLPFSEAVEVGDLLYLSGQIGVVPGTLELAPGGIRGEATQTMENIKSALSAHGYSMGDVVKCTVMLADIGEWATFNEVYKTFFTAPYPARSAFGANGLGLGARTEVECIAARR